MRFFTESIEKILGLSTDILNLKYRNKKIAYYFHPILKQLVPYFGSKHAATQTYHFIYFNDTQKNDSYSVYQQPAHLIFYPAFRNLAIILAVIMGLAISTIIFYTLFTTVNLPLLGFLACCFGVIITLLTLVTCRCYFKATAPQRCGMLTFSAVLIMLCNFAIPISHTGLLLIAAAIAGGHPIIGLAIIIITLFLLFSIGTYFFLTYESRHHTRSQLSQKIAAIDSDRIVRVSTKILRDSEKLKNYLELYFSGTNHQPVTQRLIDNNIKTTLANLTNSAISDEDFTVAIETLINTHKNSAVLPKDENFNSQLEFNRHRVNKPDKNKIIDIDGKRKHHRPYKIYSPPRQAFYNNSVTKQKNIKNIFTSCFEPSAVENGAKNTHFGCSII